MKWKLRRAAARQGIWRPDQLHAVFKQVGFNPSLSKVAALWSNRPITVRLDDLDSMCIALDCTVNDLLEPETELWPCSCEGPRQRTMGEDPDPSVLSHAELLKPGNENGRSDTAKRIRPDDLGLRRPLM